MTADRLPSPNEMYPTMPDGFTTHVLDRLRVVAQERIPEEIIRSLRLDVRRDELAFVTDSLVFRLEATVLGNELPPATKTHTIAWEDTRWATWWDHLKDAYRSRWWMGWLVRRRPVQYTTITRYKRVALDVHAYRTFPESTIRFPDGLGPVHFHAHASTRDLGGPIP